ncbi:MAG TPA: NAD(P)/FAD-dependent oxidoreductase [Coleofasciculaceae cyanobacterium]
MTVDYDLVILGGTAVGRYAAAQAVQWNARVALVEPAPQVLQTQAHDLMAALHHQTLIQAGDVAQQMRRSPFQGLHWGAATELPGAALQLQWPETRSWAESIAEVLEDQGSQGHSLDLLAAAGVDVLVGQGEFCRLPRWGVSVNGRILRSRAFLLAPVVPARVPAIAGLANIDYLTLETLWQQSWTTLPDRLIILGSDPRGVELAQVFSRLGTQVTLITRTRLLPHEDHEAAQLIQAQLEAEGVIVLTQAIVHQVEPVGNAIALKVNDGTLAAEALLLATPGQLDLTALNLASIGVKWHPHSIVVNSKLQTTHAQVYACGEVLGGYVSQTLGRYEAAIALRNALFWTAATVRYQQVPLSLFTHPELARVGLTEAQARQFEREPLFILKQFTKTLMKAQIQGETTGFCKLIVRRNGEILGAHWVGTAASEAIGMIALAMQQRIKLGAIAQLPFVVSTHAELLQAIAQQWQQQRLSRWQKTGVEAWFRLRRDWSS